MERSATTLMETSAATEINAESRIYQPQVQLEAQVHAT